VEEELSDDNAVSNGQLYPSKRKKHIFVVQKSRRYPGIAQGHIDAN
jgi:hypothetical protein